MRNKFLEALDRVEEKYCSKKKKIKENRLSKGDMEMTVRGYEEKASNEKDSNLKRAYLEKARKLRDKMKTMQEDLTLSEADDDVIQIIDNILVNMDILDRNLTTSDMQTSSSDNGDVSSIKRTMDELRQKLQDFSDQYSRQSLGSDDGMSNDDEIDLGMDMSR